MSSNYTIAVATDRDDLVSEVNRLLGEGWKIAGGVSVCVKEYNQSHTIREYSQALEREYSLDPMIPTEEEVQLARNGKKIEAIKSHRSRTGMGLKESKDAIEKYM